MAIEGLLTAGPLDHLEETFPRDRLRDLPPPARETYLLQEIEGLSYLFNSADVGFGDREPLMALQPILDARIVGALQLKRHAIDRRVVGAVEQLRGMGSRGESWEHHWLKRVAQQWLRSRGDNARREAPMFGGRVDVYAERSDTIIEIGSTPYSRALMALTSSARGPFFITPFSRWAGETLNTDPRAAVTAFEFVMSPRNRVRLRRQLAITCSASVRGIGGAG